jgi:hypothetical protein
VFSPFIIIPSNLSYTDYICNESLTFVSYSVCPRTSSFYCSEQSPFCGVSPIFLHFFLLLLLLLNITRMIKSVLMELNGDEKCILNFDHETYKDRMALKTQAKNEG